MSESARQWPHLSRLAAGWLGPELPDPTGDPWPAVDAAMTSLDTDALFAEIDATNAIGRSPELAWLWFDLGAHFHPALAGFPEQGGDEGVTAFLEELQGRLWPHTWWGRTARDLAATVPSLSWRPTTLEQGGPYDLVGSLGRRFADELDRLTGVEIEAFTGRVETLAGVEDQVGTLICTGLLEAIDNHLGVGPRRDRVRAVLGPRSRAYLESLDD